MLKGALGHLVKSNLELSDFETPKAAGAHNTALADIIEYQPRFIIAPEVQATKIPTSMLKKMSGGDEIAGRRPHAKITKEGKSIGLPIFYGNETPKFSADTGVSSRFIALDATITDLDPTLEQRLADPDDLAPATLRRLAEWANRYLKEGLPPIPEALLQARKSRQAEADPIYEVVNEILNDSDCPEGIYGMTAAEIQCYYSSEVNGAARRTLIVSGKQGYHE